MDFGSVLYEAQKNDQNTKEKKWYRTSYSPPKKLRAQDAELSANIQRFLEKKEKEKKEKKEEEESKKQALLALRSQDKKSNKRIQSMLKRTKSANKAVLETGDTIGPAVPGVSQPDEDDYGYVSQDVAALYDKLVGKYAELPEDPLFSNSKSKSAVDISSTKDRVKAALRRNEEEKFLPRKRKRKSNKSESEDQTNSEENEKDDNDDDEESDNERLSDKCKSTTKETEDVKKQLKRKHKQMPAKPAMDFNTLLQIAAQKQHEPVTIKASEEKAERPLTQKEKLEKLEQEEREARRLANKNRKQGKTGESSSSDYTIPKNVNAVKTPRPVSSDNRTNNQQPSKVSSSATDVSKTNKTSFSSLSSDVSSSSGGKASYGAKSSSSVINRSHKIADTSSSRKPKSDSTSAARKIPAAAISESKSYHRENIQKKPSLISTETTLKPKSRDIDDGCSSSKPSDKQINEAIAKKNRLLFSTDEQDSRTGKIIKKSSSAVSTGDKKVANVQQRLPPKVGGKDVASPMAKRTIDTSKAATKQHSKTNESLPKKNSTSDNFKIPLPNRNKIVQSKNKVEEMKTTNKDGKRSSVSYADQATRRPPFTPQKVRKPQFKRHVVESDEDEYDSELDDFIDDSEDPNDYSKYISEIFGYDKSRYANVDDEDDECMESDFSQLQKEEFISTKHGILEDLADLRQRKKEKMMLKK